MTKDQKKMAKQARSRVTEQALLAALDRLLMRKSFDDLTVIEIAAEAEVTTGALYRRFDNKKALLIAAVEKGITEFQTLASINQGGYAAHLPDHQLVMNLIQDLFVIMFDNFRILKAAAFIRDDNSYAQILSARYRTADWFAQILDTSDHETNVLKHKVVFVLRMITAVYLDTLLPIAETAITRDDYFTRNQQQLDRMFQELHLMSCHYLGLSD